MKECVNCTNYSWPQPEKEPTLRCTICKFIYYCSKECQSEHWKKVHKIQCKILAGTETLSQNSHDPRNCSGCKQEALYTSSDKIPAVFTALANPQNPDFGCYFPGMMGSLSCKVSHEDYRDGGNWRAPLPFHLGDMTGLFITRTEQCIALLQTLHYKLMMTGHPLHPPQVGLIIRDLAALRTDIWNVYWKAVPGTMTDRHVYELLNCFMRDIRGGAGCNEFHQLVDACNTSPREHVTINICDTLLLVFAMSSIPYHHLKTLAQLKDVLPERVQRLVVTSDSVDSIEAKVDKVLDLLRSGLVPLVKILEVLCDGQLDRACSHCGTSATVTSLITMAHHTEDFIKRGTACVTFSGMGPSLYSCGAAPCSREAVAALKSTHVSLNVSALNLEEQYGKLRCDKCDELGLKGHRCGNCLTKYYCSQACLEQDDDVHKISCLKVERKEKKGRREREEEGRQEAELMRKKIELEVNIRFGQSEDAMSQALVSSVASAYQFNEMD